MIKPIQTIYKGYKFRSRLEARWAVFFDALNIPYEYEKEGFDLDGVWYLPDFYLPLHDYWIDVKAEELLPNSDDYKKLSSLATQIGKDVYYTVGSVWTPYESESDFGKELKNYYRPIHPGGNIASHHWWYECPKCGDLCLVCFGKPGDKKCDCILTGDDNLLQFSDTPHLVEAYKRARQARFEYGESPS